MRFLAAFMVIFEEGEKACVLLLPIDYLKIRVGGQDPMVTWTKKKKKEGRKEPSR
jgi:hypothetical protein